MLRTFGIALMAVVAFAIVTMPVNAGAACGYAGGGVGASFAPTPVVTSPGYSYSFQQQQFFSGIGDPGYIAQPTNQVLLAPAPSYSYSYGQAGFAPGLGVYGGPSTTIFLNGQRRFFDPRYHWGGGVGHLPGGWHGGHGHLGVNAPFFRGQLGW